MKAPLWQIILNVSDTDDCIEWVNSRAKGPRPYGQVWYENKLWNVHRLSHVFHIGPIPKGMDVCHSCDNPPCFNPRHLFAGTRLENMADCLRKGRNFIPRGENSPRAILTEAQVIEIRSLYKPKTRGLGYRSLAKKYGVGEALMYEVISRRSWSYL